jgi:hypothetical protein
MSPINTVREKTAIHPLTGLLRLRPAIGRQATAVAGPENSRRTRAGVLKP